MNVWAGRLFVVLRVTTARRLAGLRRRVERALRAGSGALPCALAGAGSRKALPTIVPVTAVAAIVATTAAAIGARRPPGAADRMAPRA